MPPKATDGPAGPNYGQKPAASRLPGLALALGLVLGFLPYITDPLNLSFATFMFRAMVLPLAGGLFLFLASLTWMRLRHGPPSGMAAQMAAWGRALGRRWPLLAASALLVTLSLACHWQMQGSQEGLLKFFQAKAAQGQSGWLGSYHKGSDNMWQDWCAPIFMSQVTTRPHLDSKQQKALDQEDYAVRWVGLLSLTEPLDVELGTISDDGSLLMVDGVREVDNLGDHPPERRDARLRLAAGDHALEILYFQNKVDAFFELVMPAGLDARIRPLAPGFDRNKLRHLDRRVQMWQARGRLCLIVAMLLIIAWLLPRPLDWPARVRHWLREYWPILAVSGGASLFMLVGLGSMPGLWGDEATYGLSVHELIWQGKLTTWWMNYCDGKPLVYTAYWLAQVLPLDAFTMRLASIIWNFAGLIVLGLAAQRLMGRRSAFMVVLLMASSVWYLYFCRHATEHHAFLLPLCSLALYGMVRGRRAWWGGLVCGIALALGLSWHARFAFFLVGVVLMLAVEGRWRLVKSLAFWSGVAAFALVVLPKLLLYSATASHGKSLALEGFWPRVWLYGAHLLPGALSGELMALEFSGELLWPVLPLAPLVLLALIVSWPWLKMDQPHALARRALTWMFLGSVVATMLMARGERVRYLDFSIYLLQLWLSVGLAGLVMMPGWRKPLAWVVVAALVITGLFTYSADCLWAFSRSNGRLTHVYGLRDDNSAKISKRALYDRLSRQGRKVCFIKEWDAASLWFLDLEEGGGCRGLVVNKYPSSGCLGLAYGPPPSRIPAGAQPVPLGPKLDHKFQAWIIP